MADIKAKIRSNSSISGVLGNQDKIVAQTLRSGNVALADLSDINASGKTDGAMLIFNATTNQFDITTDIGNQNTNIIGGTY